MFYNYEIPTEVKYRKVYTISKCYCSLVRPGLENKGKVWLRKQACMDETCPECCRGAFFECKDPTGLCGPWVECKLIEKSPCRVKRPATENGGLGPKILVLSKLEVIFKQYILSIAVLVKRQVGSGGNLVPTTANIFKLLTVTLLKMVKLFIFCF